LEKQLDEVKQLLENTTVSSQDLERLENLVEKFRYEINLYFCKTKLPVKLLIASVSRG
jgi:hypothetical protein